MMLGLAAVAAFIAALVWFDMDRFAVILGPLFAAGIVCGMPFWMRDAINGQAALRAVLQGQPANSSAMLETHRVAVITWLVVLLVVVSICAMIGSMQLFDLFEYVFDDGLPS